MYIIIAICILSNLSKRDIEIRDWETTGTSPPNKCKGKYRSEGCFSYCPLKCLYRWFEIVGCNPEVYTLLLTPITPYLHNVIWCMLLRQIWQKFWKIKFERIFTTCWFFSRKNLFKNKLVDVSYISEKHGYFFYNSNRMLTAQLCRSVIKAILWWSTAFFFNICCQKLNMKVLCVWVCSFQQV